MTAKTESPWTARLRNGSVIVLILLAWQAHAGQPLPSPCVDLIPAWGNEAKPDDPSREDILMCLETHAKMTKAEASKALDDYLLETMEAWIDAGMPENSGQ